jgi:hypothetical protein
MIQPPDGRTQGFRYGIVAAVCSDDRGLSTAVWKFVRGGMPIRKRLHRLQTAQPARSHPEKAVQRRGQVTRWCVCTSVRSAR